MSERKVRSARPHPECLEVWNSFLSKCQCTQHYAAVEKERSILEGVNGKVAKKVCKWQITKDMTFLLNHPLGA